MPSSLKMLSEKQIELPHIEIEKWLSPKELAGIWGLKEDSAERWIADGTVPEKFVEHCGRWRLRVHPAAVPILREIFAAAHD